MWWCRDFQVMKDFVEVQPIAYGLRLRRYHADGAGELAGQHIRKYVHENHQ